MKGYISTQSVERDRLSPERGEAYEAVRQAGGTHEAAMAAAALVKEVPAYTGPRWFER